MLGAVKPVFGFCHNVYMYVMLGRPQGASVVPLLLLQLCDLNEEISVLDYHPLEWYSPRPLPKY